ncbi:putative reverse transcriptase domain-containing protein [Tanacetum coccineum]
MSSDNASSAVTYTSISSDSNGTSWGIPLVNGSELSEMDPYEEVAQQGQAPPLSPAYAPDPMELDEHVPVYVLKPEHPEYHVPSDDVIQMKKDSIDYLNEPEDDDEDLEEDPEEDHTDYPADKEDSDDEPSDDDDDDDDTDDEDEDPTEDEEEEENLALANSSVVPVVDPVPSAGDTEAFETDKARKTVRLEPPMSASMEAHIAEHAAVPIPPTSPAYDQAPLAESSAAAAARPPRCQYDFVDSVETGHGLIRSPGHDALTIARAHDRAKDVGYVRALQAFEHKMMTSIEEVNLRVSYQVQVRRRESEDFYTQLHDAQTDRMDIRLEIDIVRGQRTAYETELHESTEDRVVRQMMRTKVLEARARIDTVEDTGSGGPRRPVQPARVCSYTDFMKCQPLNFKGTEGVVGLSQWLEKMELVFHISGCAIDNQVKFAICTLLGAALTWWNGHVRTLGHDAAYAMTWGTFKKKLTDKYCTNGEIKKLEIELWNLKVRGNDVAAYTQRFQELTLMCTNTNNNNNNNKNQKAVACYECGNTGHMRRDCPKLKNCRNGNGNGTAQEELMLWEEEMLARTLTALMDITPTTLENHYDVELADGKIIGVNTIIRGCTLNFMNHPFNIDLMPVPLGSFDAIIGMDWLTKYHGVIICDEKIVRVPYGGEMLIFQGNGNNQRKESRLNIISCTKAQEYLSKGCDVFLAHITTKEAKDKSEEKRLEDVPIVRDFPEVFPEDLSGTRSCTCSTGALSVGTI